MTVGDRRLRLTHLDRVLFPEAGVTKADLLTYYALVAPYLIPHLRGRPLMLERWPEGVTGESFYQKNAGSYFPSWLPTFPMLYHQGRSTTRHPLVEGPADLLYLANQGTLTFHVFLSRTSDLEHPDLMLIDIDPPTEATAGGRPFRHAVEAAVAIRELVRPSGVDLFVKTSGKRGLHLAFDLEGGMTFDQARDWLSGFLSEVARAHPDILTAEVKKERRQGRVFLEALRMALGATVVPPYVVRPTPVASVSTPLTWEELEDLQDPWVFTIRNVPERLERIGDLWAPLADPEAPPV